MTALKWITTEAKKLKKKFPKKEWKDLVKQASAIYAAKHKGKSPVGKKKTTKKKVGAIKKRTTKKTATKTHKDTKSHNVNIRVVSGTKSIYDLIHSLEDKRGKLKRYIIFNGKMGEHYYFNKEEIKNFKKEIPTLNKQILQLKKIAKEQEKLKKIIK